MEVTMSGQSKVVALCVAVLLTMYLVGCDKEKATPPAPSASAPAASAPAAGEAASAAPVASAPEKKPSHPCPEGSTGKGTFEDPCKAKGKTRIMEVTWNKKIGDKGPTFQIVSKAKIDVVYGKVVVYFYDKAGK